MTGRATLERLWAEWTAAEVAWSAVPSCIHQRWRKRKAAADAALDALQAQAVAMGWVRSMGPMVRWVEAFLAGAEEQNTQRGAA